MSRLISFCTFALVATALTVNAQETETTVKSKTRSSGGEVQKVTYTGCVQSGTEAKTYVLNKVVPKTRIQGGMYLRLEGKETEPIGMRIIETPENVEHTEELRDPRSGFIAYAPVGSIKKGEALVTTGGNGRTVQCSVCHGADLKGLGPVPGLAGRSPSYMVRQMYDMQVGARHGVWTDLMKPVVAKLTDEDFVSIAAYLSSRTP